MESNCRAIEFQKASPGTRRSRTWNAFFPFISPNISICVEDEQLQKALKASLQEQNHLSLQCDEYLRAIRLQLNSTLFIQKVIGDGSCMFRTPARSFQELTGVQHAVAAVRQTCVENIRSTPELFQRFADQTAADRYLSEMSLPDTYGDELCLHSLASFYEVGVHVYTPLYGMHIFNEDGVRTVRLSYNGTDYYDVILHRQPLPVNRVSEFSLSLAGIPEASNEPSNCEISDTITLLSTMLPHGTCILTFYPTYIPAIYLGDIYSSILSDVLSDVYSGILSDILSGSLSDILSGILSGILSHNLSGIFSGILSDIFYPAYHLAYILTVYFT